MEDVKLTWSCGGGAQTLGFSAMQQDDEALVSRSGHSMRANGLTQIADDVLGPWPGATDR